MAIDEPLRAEIVDQTHDGRGVADLDGQRVFVSGALIGERVLLVPRKRRRRFQEAELLQIDRAANCRIEPSCTFFGRCGGCVLQHMSHSAQLEFKQRQVVESLTRIGQVAPAQWLDPVTATQWAYRRRARLGVRYVGGKGRALVGFRERATSYITDMSHCPVIAAPIGPLIGELSNLITACSLRDRIPQLEVAVGDGHSAIVVRALAPLSATDAEAFADFGRRHDIDMFVQPGGPGTIAPISKPSRKLFYQIDDFDIRIEFAPTDFIQVNRDINNRMVYETVVRADLHESDRVLDLYCGLGNISLPLAQNCRELVGVEGDPGLVARAINNASINDIGNTRFVTADLSLEQWSFLQEPWDIVVLDPPRTGAARAVAQMAQMAPRRVIYVSCHPATLARDARDLVQSQGYRLSSARLFDMFPHTHHVEVMAVFDRVA